MKKMGYEFVRHVMFSCSLLLLLVFYHVFSNSVFSSSDSVLVRLRFPSKNAVKLHNILQTKP